MNLQVTTCFLGHEHSAFCSAPQILSFSGLLLHQFSGSLIWVLNLSILLSHFQVVHVLYCLHSHIERSQRSRAMFYTALVTIPASNSVLSSRETSVNPCKANQIESAALVILTQSQDRISRVYLSSLAATSQLISLLSQLPTYVLLFKRHLRFWKISRLFSPVVPFLLLECQIQAYGIKCFLVNN